MTFSVKKIIEQQNTDYTIIFSGIRESQKNKKPSKNLSPAVPVLSLLDWLNCSIWTETLKSELVGFIKVPLTE